MAGYKIFSNKSRIKQADGVDMFIKENINESTSNMNYGRLSILHSNIKMGNKINQSALYGSHDFQNLNSFKN